MKIHVLGADTFAGRHTVTALCDMGQEDVSGFVGTDAIIDCREIHPPLTRLRLRLPPDPRLAGAVGAAREAGVRRLVVLSSALAYGPDQGGRLNESSPLRPVHTYERLKARDEEWIRAAPGIEVVVVRAAQPFGPGESLAGAWLSRLASGRLRLPGGGRGPRTFISGPDLGRALVAAALRGRPGGVYLAGGFDACWRDLLAAAGAAAKVPLRVADVPYDLAYVTATLNELKSAFDSECWPSMFAVDLVAKPLLLDDGHSRRELTWSPKIGEFAELADLGALLRVPTSV
jgi:nucleoside-diphosphate-sugar epimerase